MWWILFAVVVLALSALAFCLYRSTVCRYDQRVIEEYEETRREQQRLQGSQPRSSTVAPVVHAAAPDEGEFDTECADVLAQLEQRRKALRRSERLARH